eukprot:234755-Ditylum_brightwellii.AAC.1
MQQLQDKTSNDGGKTQNDQTKQAIVVENATINWISRRDNMQERRGKEGKKSVSKVNVRCQGRK